MLPKIKLPKISLQKIKPQVDAPAQVDASSSNVRNYERLSMNFDDALNAKNDFGWTDAQIVRQFSKLEPEKVKDYIFQELNNPAIDDATKLKVFNENPQLTFTPSEITAAVHGGHGEIVNLILKRQPNFIMTAGLESVNADQFKVFQIIFNRGRERSTISQMLDDTVRKKMLEHAIRKNAIPFAEYGFNRIRALSPQMLAGGWYSQMVSNYIKMGGRMDMLDFLLAQPEWNPGTIQNLLRIMSEGKTKRNIFYITRLGREFLNPRLEFRRSDGIQIKTGMDSLNAAIHEAGQSFHWHHVEDILKRIRDRYYDYFVSGAFKDLDTYW